MSVVSLTFANLKIYNNHIIFSLESSLDGIRSESLQLRSLNTELKAELTATQGRERLNQKEAQSYKIKFQESEQQIDTLLKQVEVTPLKSTISPGQTNRKKDKHHSGDRGDQQREVDQLKQQLIKVEKECKEAQSEAKSAKNLANKLEMKLKSAEHRREHKENGKAKENELQVRVRIFF